MKDWIFIIFDILGSESALRLQYVFNEIFLSEFLFNCIFLILLLGDKMSILFEYLCCNLSSASLVRTLISFELFSVNKSLLQQLK